MSPRARAADPTTSHAAASSVDMRASQRQVLSLFRRFGPMHHDRLIGVAKWCGVLQSPSGLRTRTRELADLGLLRDSGRTVLLPSRRAAVVWEVAP